MKVLNTGLKIEFTKTDVKAAIALARDNEEINVTLTESDKISKVQPAAEFGAIEMEVSFSGTTVITAAELKKYLWDWVYSECLDNEFSEEDWNRCALTINDDGTVTVSE